MGFPLADSRSQRIIISPSVSGHLCLSQPVIYVVIRALLSSDRATTPTVTHSIYQHYTASYSTLWYWLKDLKQTERKLKQKILNFHKDTFVQITLLSLKNKHEIALTIFAHDNNKCPKHLDFIPEAEKDMKIQLYVHI